MKKYLVFNSGERVGVLEEIYSTDGNTVFRAVIDNPIKTHKSVNIFDQKDIEEVFRLVTIFYNMRFQYENLYFEEFDCEQVD